MTPVERGLSPVLCAALSCGIAVLYVPMLALISSWLLCFTLSLDDLVISSFVAGPGASTLPMVIYSKVKLGVSPDINALASLIVCAVGVCIIAAGWLVTRADRRRALETRHAVR